MADLSSLIGKVEGLAGPDREVDASVMAFVTEGRVAEHQDVFPGMYWCDNRGHWSAPELTSSLDSVVALVERVRPGWEWDVGSIHQDFRSVGEPRWIASVAGPITWVPGDPEDGGLDEPRCDTTEGRAATPALALLLALLCSLSSPLVEE